MVQGQRVKVEEKFIAGLVVKNVTQKELGPTFGRIIPTYMQTVLPSIASFATNPGVQYTVYTEYEEGKDGPVMNFIYGTEVRKEDLFELGKIAQKLELGIETRKIPCHDYVKFSSDWGEIAQVTMKLWESIPFEDPEKLGGKSVKGYAFELYDERCKDPKNAQCDIYVQVEN